MSNKSKSSGHNNRYLSKKERQEQRNKSKNNRSLPFVAAAEANLETGQQPDEQNLPVLNVVPSDAQDAAEQPAIEAEHNLETGQQPDAQNLPVLNVVPNDAQEAVEPPAIEAEHNLETGQQPDAQNLPVLNVVPSDLQDALEQPGMEAEHNLEAEAIKDTQPIPTTLEEAGNLFSDFAQYHNERAQEKRLAHRLYSFIKARLATVSWMADRVIQFFSAILNVLAETIKACYDYLHFQLALSGWLKPRNAIEKWFQQKAGLRKRSHIFQAISDFYQENNNLHNIEFQQQDAVQQYVALMPPQDFEKLVNEFKQRAELLAQEDSFKAQSLPGYVQKNLLKNKHYEPDLLFFGPRKGYLYGYTPSVLLRATHYKALSFDSQSYQIRCCLREFEYYAQLRAQKKP